MISLLLSLPLAVSGTYAEFRTCSLFAGACHYSGEVMVDGRSAVTFFLFETGMVQGVPLKGARVAVLTQAEKNLSFEGPRRSVLFVQAQNQAQRESVLSIVKKLLGSQVGDVVQMVEASMQVTPHKNTTTWTLRDAHQKVLFQAITSDRECKACSMPGELWYEPLVKGAQVRVATVEEQTLTVPFLGEKWRRTYESAVFVGRFSG
ncbi:MAG: DUF1326 domain-containing protein [Fimbriimonadales bacterium]|nr:DUF1326 domain-containing protein [Fimbriimonadales bacterium]